MKVVRDYPRFPREVVDVSSLEVFKTQCGWSSGKPGLVEGVPSHGKGFGTRQLLKCLPA